MRCPRPINIRTDNGYATVPCGRCPQCQMTRRSEWSFRLAEELRHSFSATFITLTYDDEHLTYGENHPTLVKSDVQNFMKKLRYQQKLCSELLIRFYIVGEYGPKTLRPHYHGILFNVEPKVIQKLDEIWHRGFTSVGQVNGARIHYVSGYFLQKSSYPEGVVKPFSLMSRRPGIGYQYIERIGEYHSQTGNFFLVKDGHKMAMPKYYAEKLFTEAEREERALQIKQWIEEKDRKEWERLEKLGNDPSEVISQQIEQETDRIMKRLTKRKL